MRVNINPSTLTQPNVRRPMPNAYRPKYNPKPSVRDLDQNER